MSLARIKKLPTVTSKTANLFFVSYDKLMKQFYAAFYSYKGHDKYLPLEDVEVELSETIRDAIEALEDGQTLAVSLTIYNKEDIDTNV